MHGGCQLGMPTRVDDTPGSGCRVDCLHRAFVLNWRTMRAAALEARKLAREAATHGYSTEGAEWDAEHPDGSTFKAALIDQTAPREDPDR